LVADAGGVVLEVAHGGVDLFFLRAFQGIDAAALQMPSTSPSPSPSSRSSRRAASHSSFLSPSMNSSLRARSWTCSRAWNRSTIWVASGNFAVAMFQIQGAPSPRMLSCRTWSAPRRIPSAFTRFPNVAAGSKVAA
jgi:hypothetical protein